MAQSKGVSVAVSIVHVVLCACCLSCSLGQVTGVDDGVLPFLSLSSESTVNLTASNTVEDGYSPAIALPSSLRLGRTTASTAYVNTNGFVSFNGVLQGSALPANLSSLQSTELLLAPYWDDISLSSVRGYILYEINTDPISSVAEQVNSFIASNQTLEAFNATWLLVVQWIDVCPYTQPSCTNPNTFQAVVATDGLLTIGIFSYQCGSINWRRRAVTGYHVSSSYTAQHPLSLSNAITNIDCLNEAQSQWTNLVYYMNEVSPTAQLLSTNNIIYPFLSSSVNITCHVQGNPRPSVEWIRDSQQALPSSAIVEFTALSDITAASILILPNIMSTDYGQYTCQADSTVGSVTSSNSTTLYRTRPVRNRLNSDHELFETELGGNVYDERCRMDGKPQPTVQWIGPHGPVVNDSHISVVETVEYGSSGNIIVTSILTLINATYYYNGTYVCVGSNVININGDISVVNDSISISVKGVPAFTVLSSSVATLSESFQLIVKVYPVISPHLLNWSFTNGNNTRLQNISCNDSTCSFSNDRLTLTLYNVTLSDQGEYSISATNSYGTGTVYIPLLVQAPVIITKSPDNVTVTEGSDITVTCQSHGLPLPVITWYRNGLILTAAAAEGERNIQITDTVYQYNTAGLFLTISTLNITGVALQDRGVYSCIATNNISADIAHFTVTVQVYPNVTLFPSRVTLNTSDSLELYCTAQSVVSFSWYYGNRLLRNFTGVLVISQSVSDPPAVPFPVTAVSVLRLINISKYWEGTFSCRALDNRTGLEMIEFSSVIVQVPPSISGPLAVIAILSAPLSLSITIANITTPPVTANDITWSFTNATSSNSITGPRLLYNSSRYQFSIDQLTLHINHIEWTDAGVYSVMAQNIAGFDSIDITLSVESPPIGTSQAVSIDVLLTDSVTLPCSIMAKPLQTTSWILNGHTIPAGNRYHIETDITSQQYGALYISNSTVNDSGVYTCIATNSHGTANVTVILTVLVPPRLIYRDTPPALVDHSYTLSVNISKDAFPPVNATNMVWERINSTSAVPLRAVSTYNGLTGIVQLIFANISVADAGQYRLRVWTRAGIDSIIANLNVQAIPVVHTSNVVRTLRQGDSLLLICLADGIPQPVISWFANGRTIGALSSTFSISDTVLVMGSSYRNGVPLYRSVLNATGLLPANNGSYSCEAKNEWGGTLAQQTQLFVIPEFINHCASITCFNGATCHNEQSSFLCQCTDGWTGLYCNKPATVPSPPQFSEFPLIFYQEYETPVSISCPVTGYPQPTVNWYRDDGLIAGANTQTFVITSLTLDTRGLYYCVATNSEGNATSNTIYVKIRGLVQYRAELNFTVDFITAVIEQRVTRQAANNKTFEATKERLDKIMEIVNREMRRELSRNESISYTFFSLELISVNISSLLDPIPVLLTIASKYGGDTLLKAKVEEAFDQLIKILTDLSRLMNPVTVEHIQRFDGCLAERTIIPSPNGDPNLEFIFEWPETDISQTVTLRCPCGPEGFDIGVVRNISRMCQGNFTDGAEWEIVNRTACNFSTSARKLCQLAFLTETDELLTGLDNITAVTDNIGSLELSLSTVFVENLTLSVSGDTEFTDSFLDVVDNLVTVDRESFVESNEEAKTSGRILQSFEEVINRYPLELNTTVLRRTFAVSVRNLSSISTDADDDIVFSINENLSDDFTRISDKVISYSDTNQPVAASIVIPVTLVNNISQNTSSLRLVQSVFNTDLLFLRRESLIEELSYLKVGSLLVSASFVDQNIVDADELINITLRKDETLRDNVTDIHCSFWDHSADGNYGNWSQYGCQLLSNTTTEAVCGCNHLTTFALLLDVKPEPLSSGLEEALMGLSYLGCAVSLVCLTIIILTYTIEKHLRRTNNGQLLINMSCALMGLYIVYIPSLYAASVEPLCIILSFMLSYFFLATFLAMASEATILYIELVRVFTKGKGAMVAKAVIITWVLPLFVVGFALAPNYNKFKTDDFCRPVEWQYWIGFIGPFCAIYIYNWIMFLVIIVSIFKQQIKIKSDTGNADLKTSTTKQFTLMITLSILFGLGWGIGLASTHSFPIAGVRYTLQTIFVIASGFQGLFLFIFYGIRVSKVRKVWLKWFYIITSQHDKAVHVDFTLRSTYTTSIKNKQQPTIQLGTFDDQEIQLKGFTKSTTSWSSNSPQAVTPDLPQSDNEELVALDKLLEIKLSRNRHHHATVHFEDSSPNGHIGDNNSIGDSNSIVSADGDKTAHSIPEKSDYQCIDQSESCCHDNCLHVPVVSSHGNKRNIKATLSNFSNVSELIPEPV